MRNPFEDPKPLSQTSHTPKLDVRRLTTLDRGMVTLLIIIPIGFVSSQVLMLLSRLVSQIPHEISMVFSGLLVFGYSIGLWLLVSREPSDSTTQAIKISAPVSPLFWIGFRLIVLTGSGMGMLGGLSLLWGVVGSVLDICAVLFLYRLVVLLECDRPIPPMGALFAAFGISVWGSQVLSLVGLYGISVVQWGISAGRFAWWGMLWVLVYQLKRSLDETQAVTE